MRVVALVGGSGFLGGALSEELKDRGFAPRVVSRSPRSRGGVDWRVYRPMLVDSLSAALEGCHAAINLVGILNSRLFHPNDFYDAHVKFVSLLVSACKGAHVNRFLHFSGIKASAFARSEYLRTKSLGEVAARASDDMEVAIFRLGPVFGAADRFFNRLHSAVKIAPGFVLVPCPNALLSPVFVGDVAKFVVDCLENDEGVGGVYDLRGPNVYLFKDIFSYVVALSGRRLRLVAMPDFLSRAQARVFGVLPGKLFTIDNYYSLLEESGTYSQEGECDTTVEEIVPYYLS